MELLRSRAFKGCAVLVSLAAAAHDVPPLSLSSNTIIFPKQFNDASSVVSESFISSSSFLPGLNQKVSLMLGLGHRIFVCSPVFTRHACSPVVVCFLVKVGKK